jgi:hypothetical protein
VGWLSQSSKCISETRVIAGNKLALAQPRTVKNSTVFVGVGRPAR